MIWIDSSFAVEWLLGLPRVRGVVDINKQQLKILPMQYMEVLNFFLKKGKEIHAVSNQLEACQLFNPDTSSLQLGVKLYHQARLQNSKTSLADALLAAVCHQTKETLLTFDGDFATLGLRKKTEGVWGVG